MALLGIGLLTIFVRRQFKITNPLLDLRVFRSQRYCLGLAITILVTAAIMAPELTLPLFNQDILKVSPIVSGMVMIPSALAMAALSPLAGRLYDEFGIKQLAMVGTIIGLVAAIPMMFYNASTGIILVTILYAIRCAGLILSYTPAEVYALNALPREQVTSGNTIIVTMIQVANSFGTALAMSVQSVVANWSTAHNTSTSLATIHGYQWSFGTTVLITLISCLLVTKIKSHPTNNL